jgi:hypothetical protein
MKEDEWCDLLWINQEPLKPYEREAQYKSYQHPTLVSTLYGEHKTSTLLYSLSTEKRKRTYDTESFLK